MHLKERAGCISSGNNIIQLLFVFVISVILQLCVCNEIIVDKHFSLILKSHEAL